MIVGVVAVGLGLSGGAIFLATRGAGGARAGDDRTSTAKVDSAVPAAPPPPAPGVPLPLPLESQSELARKRKDKQEWARDRESLEELAVAATRPTPPRRIAADPNQGGTGSAVPAGRVSVTDKKSFDDSSLTP